MRIGAGRRANTARIRLIFPAMTKSARTVLVPAGLYRAIKYVIYLLLAANIFMFLREEWRAAEFTLGDGLDLRSFVSSFAQTVDTAAWVMLLLLFELETSVIPDARLRGGLRWALHGLRALFYLFIVYAFYGYSSLCMDLYDAVLVAGADACAHVAPGASMLVETGTYLALTADNCGALGTAPTLWQVGPASDQVLAAGDALDAARRLAWTDVINAGTWLVIVLLLEVDVRLQLAGHLRGGLLRLSEFTKVVLYSVLLACALYWGYAGTFLDFWDAFLWLLAFALIELNVLEWQAETK